MEGINYVIPCWGGRRNSGHDEDYAKDRGFYVKAQLQQLTKLKHNLRQITFVSPKNPPEGKQLYETLKTFPASIRDTKIEVILDHPYPGWSYASFAYVYEKYRTEFEYYIFCEDDYVPVLDNFDEVLVRMMNNQTDYLCSMRAIGHEGKAIASISNGIMKTKSLEKIRANYGKILHGNQVEFSYGFVDTKLKIWDFNDRIGSHYKTPYWADSMVYFNDWASDYLWVPVQMLSALTLTQVSK